jgi:hypothetical protein
MVRTARRLKRKVITETNNDKQRSYQTGGVGKKLAREKGAWTILT